MENPGYHLIKIEKGILGELSKIREELDELQDASNQKCKILELVELSDLLGAVEAYINKYHNGYTINDLYDMHKITKRAFESGNRK